MVRFLVYTLLTKCGMQSSYHLTNEQKWINHSVEIQVDLKVDIRIVLLLAKV